MESKIDKDAFAEKGKKKDIIDLGTMVIRSSKKKKKKGKLDNYISPEDWNDVKEKMKDPKYKL